MLASLALVLALVPQVIPSLKEWKDGSGAWKPTAAEQKSQVKIRTGKTGLGPEGYILTVTPAGATITSETTAGAFWATRTLRQVIDRTGSFPCGTARDWPDYPVRGFMFDCGRKPFALATLRRLVDICAYYKLNDLQLHLSDNYIWLGRYNAASPEALLKHEPSAGGFRLESKVKGLASTDLAYTKKDFRALVSYAKKRGVRIVPELDVPGHAFQMVRLHPELMYRGAVSAPHKDIERVAMFDLTNPKSFDFIASIFDEYLDGEVFTGDVVHIGTDEYYGDAESYRGFADRLLRHVQKKGRTPRFWGSLSRKRGRTPVVVKGTQMHIWSMDWQNPKEAVDAGYDIINILDRWTYCVPNGTGNVGAYGDDINTRDLYEHWGPRVFPNVNADQLPKAKVLGGEWAVWNDNSFMTDPGLCGRDLLARIAKNCAAVAEKTWREGAPSRGYDDFLALVNTDLPHLGAAVPGPVEKSFRTGRTEKPLYATDELRLYAASPVDGKVGFWREGAWYSFDYTIPKDRTVDLVFRSADRVATLLVDGQPAGGTPRRQFYPEACRYFTLPMD